MDIVLDGLDDYGLDSFYAWLLPLRIPLSDAQRVAGNKILPSASAATLKFLQSALPTASSSLAALGTMLPSNSQGLDSQSEQWTTVSAWPRDDWRRQTLSVSLLSHVKPCSHSIGYLVDFVHPRRHPHHVLCDSWSFIQVAMCVHSPGLVKMA